MTTPLNSATLSNSDWIAISSVVIAILALFATAWQSWLAWVHNRLSVTPHIMSATDSNLMDHGIEIKLTLKNVGVGPALVEDRYFEVDGIRFEPVGQDLVDAVCRRVFGETFKCQIRQNGMFGGRSVLPAGSEFVIAVLFFPGMGDDAKQVISKEASRANFVVKYRSLYGKRFTFCTD